MKHFSICKTHKDMCGSAFQLRTITKSVSPSEGEDHLGTVNYNSTLQTKEAARDDVLSVGI